LTEQIPFNEYIQLLKNGILRPLCKIEWLRPDESVQSSIAILPLTSSSLTADASSASVRRSVSLVLDNSNKDFLPSTDNLWIGAKFQMYLGYQDNQDREIYFPQGVFVLFDSDPSIISAYSSQTVNIVAQDKWCLLDIPIGHIYTVPSGNKITDVIPTILKLVGDNMPPIMENLDDIAPFDLIFAESSTYGEMLRSLANLYSRECYYDTTGHFILKSFVTQDTSETIYDLTTDDSTYLGSTLQLKYSQVFNHIYVTGASQNSNIAYFGEAVNDDLTSNSRRQLIGDKPMAVINDAKLNSNDLCQQRADHELQLAKRVQQNISINSIAIYNIDVNKAITVSDDAIGLFKKRFIIQQYNLQLDAKSPMTITGFLFNDGIDFDDRLTMSSQNTTGS